MNNKDSGSTQNRNSRYEYICEQQQNRGVFDYYTSKYYGVNNNNYYFSMGSVPKHQENICLTTLLIQRVF